MRTWRLCIVLAGLTMMACGGSDASEGAQPEAGLLKPTIGDGKQDIVDNVKIGSILGYGAEKAVTGTFDENAQFFGYPVQVGDAATVTIETTQVGTAADLDNTLFVYGPMSANGKYGTTEVAFDNDSGYGKHAKISDLALEKGTYLVVTGTPLGTGRGDFRIELTCASGQCETSANPFAACADEMHATFEDCIDESIVEGDSDIPQRIGSCIEDLAGHVWQQECEGQNAPAWCAYGEAAMEEHMLPLCKETLDQEYGVRKALPFEPLELPQGIVTQVSDADQQAGDFDYSEVKAVALHYTWTEAVPVDAVQLSEAVASAAGFPATYSTIDGTYFERKITEMSESDVATRLTKLYFDPQALLGEAQTWMGAPAGRGISLNVEGERDRYAHDYFMGVLLVYPEQSNALYVYLRTRPDN